jgi:predicted membrane channel-forming protein YqfA (hemolysin III family)
MRRRTRKFIGACVMLSFVSIYMGAIMLIAQTDHIRHAHGLLQAVFFLLAGLCWVLPLMPLIRWMERPDRDDSAVQPS